MNRPVFGMVLVAGLAMVGCRTTRDKDSERPPLAPRLEPTVLQYVDSDAFDGLFETSLVNRDPVIVIRTNNEKPDWNGRLNAWIAAWNMGGKAERRVIRGQFPLPGQQVDAEFLREFRLLVFGVVDRAEGLAKSSSAWFQEERTRSRRVALLQRYNLRFHMNESNHIHLIFFNGDHAAHYPDFVKTLNQTEVRAWSRNVECSICDKLAETSSTSLMPKASE